MAGKKKIRQLTGTSLDFGDMFGDMFGDDSSSTEQNKGRKGNKGSEGSKSRMSEDATSTVSSKKSKSQAPVSAKTETESVSTQDLEAWLQQEKQLSAVQTELASIQERHQTELEALKTDKVVLEEQMQTFQKKHADEMSALRTELDSLKAELLQEKQRVAALQEQVRVSKDETERALAEKEKQHAEHLAQSDWIPLTGLLNDRGLRTHTEYMSFFKAVGESTHGWTVWKDAQVHKETMQDFLKQQVHLICESISDSSTIPGVCIPVDNDKCEVSGGVPLQAESRELITEILLQGWSKVLFLGVPRHFVNFLRQQLSQTTIEVQVDPRETNWVYTTDMNSYPVILIFGGGADKIPPQCTAKVFCYNAETIGQSIQACRQAIQQLSEE